MESEYEIRESKRARSARITVYPNGSVVVTKPSHMRAQVLDTFVQERREWIAHTVEKVRRRQGGESLIELPTLRQGSRAHKEAVEAARVLVHSRLQFFNEIYHTIYGMVSIRDQKTRWGSCSHKNNVSFNYRIVYLPSELADYIIVHELCHTIEHNHSPRFWAQVARALPHHALLRKEIRTRYRF